MRRCAVDATPRSDEPRQQPGPDGGDEPERGQDAGRAGDPGRGPGPAGPGPGEADEGGDQQLQAESEQREASWCRRRRTSAWGRGRPWPPGRGHGSLVQRRVDVDGLRRLQATGARTAGGGHQGEPPRSLGEGGRDRVALGARAQHVVDEDALPGRDRDRVARRPAPRSSRTGAPKLSERPAITLTPCWPGSTLPSTWPGPSCSWVERLPSTTTRSSTPTSGSESSATGLPGGIGARGRRRPLRQLGAQPVVERALGVPLLEPAQHEQVEQAPGEQQREPEEDL